MSKPIIRFVFPLVLTAMLAAALFGFLVMSGSGHMMAGCGGLMAGAGCAELPLLAHFESHLHTFQSISSAAFSVQLLYVLSVFVFFAASISARISRDGSERGLVEITADFFSLPQCAKFMHWLARHEKRDPSFAYAMR